MHSINRNILKIAGLLSGVMLVSVSTISIVNAQEAVPSWQHAAQEQTDAMLHDPMIMYNAGGLDGKVAVIGLPSMRTYR
ncbi:MAG: hypothetical protein GY807_13865, partial [Gammaproteobacteria bacterium]|nr:hypothetical protein [Gammaproteobacteria bacterium]